MSLDCSLFPEVSSRLKFDGESEGDFTAATGESGAGGGGGGLIAMADTFWFPFSSRDRLFIPCSKNLDRPLFC